MRVVKVLHKCLLETWQTMHAGRTRVLLLAVQALMAGRRLVLMDLARQWPAAQRVRAPLKALDRLLSNHHLHRERERIYAGMARWLLRSPQPIIVIDWSNLKADRSWHLLRAVVPVGGRGLPILDMVFADGQQNTPKAEQLFLQRLKAIVPEGIKPIVVTDAGFRGPWFRAVQALGWYWLGRLRHTTYVKPAQAPDHPDQWLPCKTLHAQASAIPREMALMDTARSRPWVCHVALLFKPAKGRSAKTLQGAPKRSAHSKKNAAREREPWIIVASPDLPLSAKQMTQLYARRMQIELSFRDLKSHQYGQGFEDSLTRKGPRIEVLLLVQTLAAFASWLVGLACQVRGLAQWMSPHARSKREPCYCTMRIGQEALLHHWPAGSVDQWMALLRNLPDSVIQQLSVPEPD